MADCTLTINGQPVRVPEGTLVAVAVALAGVTAYRRSVSGEPRAPLCGMPSYHQRTGTADQLPDTVCQRHGGDD